MNIHAFATAWTQRIEKVLLLAMRPSLIPVLRYGVLPSMEHARTPFGECATVLDVGASRGQFASLARCLWPAARVICFEPLGQPLRRLRALAESYRLDVYDVALDDRTGLGAMNIAGHDDSSSLLPIAPRQVAEFPGTSLVGTADVRVMRLDDLDLELRRPCLLKIDTQGSELRVLRGAARTLEQVDQVYVECSFVRLYDGQPLSDEIVGELARAGLRIAGVYNISSGRNGEQLQADFLFRRGDFH